MVFFFWGGGGGTYEFLNAFQQTPTVQLCSHKIYYMANLVQLLWMTLYKISLLD